MAVAAGPAPEALTARALSVYVTPLVSPVMVQVAVWLPVGNAGEGVQLPAGTLPGPVAVTR